MKEYISLKELEALAILCTHAVRELKADNYNFNIDLFLRACEK